MARMIPEGGPHRTESLRAEPDVYWRLSKLDDRFTIIHSLPWLSAAVKTIDPTYAPTGEIDFIIFHPKLGILTIEVKGGNFKYDRHKFVYLRTNQSFDPISQIRRGTFAISKWMQQAGLRIPVGYAWIFPDVDMTGKPIPPAMEDATSGFRLTIDYRELPYLTKRVVEIMEYWKHTLKVPEISRQSIEKIVDLICPSSEYNLGWDARIEYDNKRWLELNAQQRRNLKQILEFERAVVYGRPGTGKTILAIALARLLSDSGKKVLFLLYNSPIKERISVELEDTLNVDVKTFHGLCALAEKKLRVRQSRNSAEWFNDIAHISLDSAITTGKMNNYDAVIIDEGQIFHREWYFVLMKWIDRIYVFCDETQAFPFEKRLTNREIVEEIVDAEHAGLLTVNLRSPKTVFERIAISLPTDYQQYSPRPDEPDTLRELVSFDPYHDLQILLKRLNEQGVATEQIAIVTTREQVKSWQKNATIDELRTFASTIDTSARVRGLEFPIVIVYGISIADTLYLINAYARATTGVIAIYSVWDLNLSVHLELRGESFYQELFKNPDFQEVIASPWDYVQNRLGWNLKQIAYLSSEVYWSRSLGSWVIHSQDTNDIGTELWLKHLLLTTESPVFVVQTETDRGLFSLLRYELDERRLINYVKASSLHIAICDACGKFAVRTLDDEIICTHCKKRDAHLIPNIESLIKKCDKTVSNPASYTKDETFQVGINLLAYAALMKLKPHERKIIETYVASRSSNRIGYQALLILTGVDILKSQPGFRFRLSWFISKYRSWVDKGYRDDLSNILPTCTNYWYSQGWLEKIDRGVYIRCGEIKAKE